MPTESEIINSIRSRLQRASGVVVGVGDDAAVLKPRESKDLLACCDLMVEGVHFRRDWCEPTLIGRKALAINLSDIAAMGGTPRYAMISVAIMAGSPASFVESLFDGIFELADQTGVAVIGGDTSSSPGPLFIDVSVIGDCEVGKAVTRAGARPGDQVFVTGTLGASALGLRLLERGARLKDPGNNQSCEEALLKHLIPSPRLKTGSSIGQAGLATAMIDISDGLSTDLCHLAEESDCGAIIDAGSIPIAQSVLDYITEDPATDPLDLALNGGEEYELLFATDPGNLARISEVGLQTGVRMTRIGEMIERKQLILRFGDEQRPLQVKGYEHLV
jgi:thiamine-monophosphate kinase